MNVAWRSIKGKIYVHMQSLCLKKWLYTGFQKGECKSSQKLDACRWARQNNLGEYAWAVTLPQGRLGEPLTCGRVRKLNTNFQKSLKAKKSQLSIMS